MLRPDCTWLWPSSSPCSISIQNTSCSRVSAFYSNCCPRHIAEGYIDIHALGVERKDSVKPSPWFGTAKVHKHRYKNIASLQYGISQKVKLGIFCTLRILFLIWFLAISVMPSSVETFSKKLSSGTCSQWRHIPVLERLGEKEGPFTCGEVTCHGDQEHGLHCGSGKPIQNPRQLCRWHAAQLWRCHAWARRVVQIGSCEWTLLYHFLSKSLYSRPRKRNGPDLHNMAKCDNVLKAFSRVPGIQ